MTWEEAEVLMPAEEDTVTPEDDRGGAAAGLAAFGRRSSGEDPYISQFDEASQTKKPLVLWVYTESSERRLRRDREASQQFFDEVLNTPEATAKLAQCVTVKIEVDGLDRDVLREYNIRRDNAPQLIVFDYEGDRIGSLSDRNTADHVAEAVQQALDRCAAMAEREARRR